LFSEEPAEDTVALGLCTACQRPIKLSHLARHLGAFLCGTLLTNKSGRTRDIDPLPRPGPLATCANPAMSDDARVARKRRADGDGPCTLPWRTLASLIVMVGAIVH
jgi:hypothetical protein